MSLALFLISIFTFVELNCENLFDCEHDSLKQDEEFTPDGWRHWNHYRYWQKLNHIGQEIIACGEEDGEWSAPDMVALCEVENDSVMHDLTRRSLLRRAGYEYIVTNSADVRGIDVALLYLPSSFRLIETHAIRVSPMKGMRPTRDILYASGETASGDTLHVMVIHAPSRYGGARATRPHRMLVAEKVAETIDSIRSLSPRARIMVAGDFNDSSSDRSIRRLVRHGMTDIGRGARADNGARGTYRYRGEWSSLDHILCSEPLEDSLLSCRVGDFGFLMEADDKYGGLRPKRNYIGPQWRNGFSDHLPIIAKFSF